ncbi:hypothetical protein H6F75_00605 [Nodosilinea sp. FACHB-131]|uniref:hypothetical protein n=1 Tax=Cyanophyceae TaxID=3028117 RepID=UPI001684E5B5|nr:hypothetical protein [Nodosilinea sp. FACHB-131]MBD1871971.1 hypothetical protein [Nodosilinea sp. FACHB-131]
MIYSTDFTAFNGGPVGAPFVGDLASTNVMGGQVYFTSASKGIAYNAKQRSYAVQVTWTPALGSSIVQLFCRNYTGASDDDYIAMRVDSGADTVSLRFDDRRTSEITVDSKSFTFNADTAYVLKLVARGRFIEAYVNGVLQLNFRTAMNQYGSYVGFRTLAGSDLFGRFTSFSVSTARSTNNDFWNPEFPKLTKHPSNPIFSGAAQVGFDAFLNFSVIKCTDLGITPLVAGQPYQAYYSKDHAAGTEKGGTFVATAPTPLGPWTRFGSATTPYYAPPDAGYQQCETPVVIKDPITGDLIMIHQALGSNFSGVSQGSLMARAGSNQVFSFAGLVLPPSINDNIRDRGHTGYFKFYGRDSSGYWWGNGYLGTRTGGNGAFREAGRRGVWKISPDFTVWKLWAEEEEPGTEAGKFYTSGQPLIYKNEPYVISSAVEQVGAGQFDVRGELRLFKMNSGMTGPRPGSVSIIDTSPTSPEYQSWEGASDNIGCCGIFVETSNPTKDTLYVYYSVSRSPTKMGVAYVDLPKGHAQGPQGTFKPIQRNEARGRGLNFLMRGIG